VATLEATIKTTNAITLRLDQLQLLWDEFTGSPTLRCCCWHVQQDELTMIDAFCQVNGDESSDTPDIFLRLESPFSNIKNYGKTLTTELAALVDADREYLAEDDIFLDWQPKYEADPKNSAVGFLREFFHFAHSLELEEGKVVVFLSPSAIENKTAWELWWMDVLSLQLPDKIALMVCETVGQETLQNVVKRFPDKIKVFQPTLDMPNAIRELMNEYGDQEDGCTHFRKAFYELTQAVAKREAADISQKGKTALILAREVGFPHLEIAVLCTTGNGFMISGKTESGIVAFDEALNIAEASKDKPLIKEMPDLKVDLPGGNLFEQLAVQVLFFKAAGFLSLKKPRYEDAFAVYQQAEERLTQMLAKLKSSPDEEVDWTNGGIVHFHRLEAMRMSGFCSEKIGRNQQALSIYAKVVSTAEKMPPDMRQSTMLPYVGRALLGICHNQGMKKEYWNVRKKMDDLLGEDWEEQLPKAA
jgi:tetratricopeptide (TPR) repeat protein